VPAVSESIAGADGALHVVLGCAVMVLFAGIVGRALVDRLPRRGRQAPPSALMRPSNTAAQAIAPGLERPGRAAPGPAAVSPRSPVAACEPRLAALSPVTLAPLARVLEHSGRLRAAEDRVAAELTMLTDGRWLVERSVRVENARIPFLMLGAGGVFVLWATDGAWTLADLRFMADRAAEVRRRLPGYGGPVHAAMCLAFDEIQPRSWFGGQEHGGRGGWVLGVDRLRPWLLSFGTEHGLRVGIGTLAEVGHAARWACGRCS